MINRFSIIFLAGLLTLASCADAPTPPDIGPLAMEAWIDNDDFPVVVLTQSLSPSVDDIDAGLAMARWGKVTITDGRDTVVMTEGAENDMMPPYAFRTFAMRGEVGRTYTVIGEYNGKRVTATARIPEPPIINDVVFEKIPGAGDMYSGMVRFIPAESTDTTRYVVFVRVRNSQSRHYPSMLGAVSCAPGTKVAEVPLFRGVTVIDQQYNANFVTGDDVDVIVAHVEDIAYRFWDGYQNAVYFGNNVFLSTSASLPTNVVGGYGIFSGRGVDRKVVKVP